MSEEEELEKSNYELLLDNIYRTIQRQSVRGVREK